MKRTILIYGLALAALTAFLKFIEYRFFVRDISLEIFVGITAVLFAVLGVWAGRRLTRVRVVETTAPAPTAFVPVEEKLEQTGISRREYEVLELIAEGYSNREIADKLFVSLSTVKTHSSNLFMKLDARRRTEAVKNAKELGLLP